MLASCYLWIDWKILLEFNWAFCWCVPLWLAPVQVKVLPVNNEYHLDYAKEVTELLKDKGFKVELDAREEKLGYRIREGQMEKVPYLLVIR